MKTPRNDRAIPTVLLVECDCEALVYEDGGGIGMKYCPLHESAVDLLDSLSEIVKWLDDNGLSHTKSGGVYPLLYEGTEYDFVTAARALIAKARKE